MVSTFMFVIKSRKNCKLGAKMLLEHEVKKLLQELGYADVAKIDLGGGSITVKAFDHGKKIFLSTPVYFGGNYIPKSVRSCLKQRAPFESFVIRTTLKVDEDHYSIHLNYIGDIETMTNQRLIGILEDFSGLAARWRDYLDEHDQNDLVHIPVK